MTAISLRVDEAGNVLTRSGVKLGRVISKSYRHKVTVFNIALASGHDVQATQVHGSHEVIAQSFIQQVKPKPPPEPKPEPELPPIIKHRPVKKHAPDFYGGWNEFRVALPREIVDRILYPPDPEDLA